MKRAPRFIAFYLPQFYPTPENDKWWGKGFTEWINVGKTKPLFRGHYQPKVPTDLGYYDLRIEEVREQQALLAREAGIEGFCYWHYWFNGKRLLDRVFHEVVESGKPDFPFSLCWANASWYKKQWKKEKEDAILIEQTYPGEEDFINHFNAMLPAFKDKRYIRVNGLLLFGVYKPMDIPNFDMMKLTWNRLAKENGLAGFYFFGFTYSKNQAKQIIEKGYDNAVVDYMFIAYSQHNKKITSKIKNGIKSVLNRPLIFQYSDYEKQLKNNLTPNDTTIPCIIPNFDHAPRSGSKFIIIHNSFPKIWKAVCKWVIYTQKNKTDDENRLIFIKAWNEWGEGNYLEPDLKYGDGYLKCLKEAIEESADEQ